MKRHQLAPCAVKGCPWVRPNRYDCPPDRKDRADASSPGTRVLWSVDPDVEPWVV